MTPEHWARLEDLYHRALEVEKNERASFVRDRCADDPELRQELERLLAEDNAAESFLEEPALPGAVASAPKRVVLKIVPEKVISWDHRKLGGKY